MCGSGWLSLLVNRILQFVHPDPQFHYGPLRRCSCNRL
eukprot:COSAG02_NODE_54775_length_294_cov_0.794872_2_plen_37_part_01